MTDAHHSIIENLHRIREEIATAASRAGRRADEVRLIGVTKYVGVEAAQALLAAGLRDLGESRPQELWRKAEALRDAATPNGEPARWHLIGHLQRNKVRRTLPVASLLHSADSPRLLAEINQQAAQLGLTAAVLLEVNISGDAAKHGLAPEEVEPLFPRIAELRHLRVHGLMGMAALEGGRDRARRDFARLRELRDRLSAVRPPEISLAELSMGMSEDFDVAIEEGATLVRVGSALFEGTDAVESRRGGKGADEA